MCALSAIHPAFETPQSQQKGLLHHLPHDCFHVQVMGKDSGQCLDRCDGRIAQYSLDRNHQYYSLIILRRRTRTVDHYAL